jgi:hypothetical protein
LFAVAPEFLEFLIVGLTDELRQQVNLLGGLAELIPMGLLRLELVVLLL